MARRFDPNERPDDATVERLMHVHEFPCGGCQVKHSHWTGDKDHGHDFAHGEHCPERRAMNESDFITPIGTGMRRLTEEESRAVELTPEIRRELEARLREFDRCRVTGA